MSLDPTHVPTLDGFDPLSEEFLADPYPILERARRECPVFFYPDMNCWVITRAGDLATAATDFETFSSRAIGTVAVSSGYADRIPPNLMDKAFIGLDPPLHTVSRRHANKAFTRGRIAALEDDIRRIANELIDGFVDDGRCDLMEQFCYPFSLRIITELLGMPPVDMPKLRQWAHDFKSLLAPVDANNPNAVATKPMSDEARALAWRSTAEAYEYYTAFVKERTERPRDDLISAMLQVRDDTGEPAISAEGVITHLTEMITAGGDTTANQIGQLVLFLDAAPDQLAEVRRDPSLLENAVEEGLRRRGVGLGLFRIAMRDVQMCGTTIPKGSLVWLVFVSAGHDESVFEDPRRFDIHRANADKHMSFGRGRHLCLGAPLARLEARIGLEELYRRIPDIRVVPGQRFVYEPVLVIFKLKSLLVEWN